MKLAGFAPAFHLLLSEEARARYVSDEVSAYLRAPEYLGDEDDDWGADWWCWSCGLSIDCYGSSCAHCGRDQDWSTVWDPRSPTPPPGVLWSLHPDGQP